MTLNEYFDKIVFINLARRPDRLEHALQQFKEHDIDACRFEGIDMGELGNHGCTASHGAVLQMIIDHEWPRTLIFEDDVKFRFIQTQALFAAIIEQVPKDWFMLYLGGHYAEKPQRRINEPLAKYSPR
jgi:GR25 family glycosyltransferase involved in LPS biosynthesis